MVFSLNGPGQLTVRLLVVPLIARAELRSAPFRTRRMFPDGIELGLMVLTAKLTLWVMETNAESFAGDRFLMRGGSLVAPMASAQFTAAKNKSYALVL